MKNKPAKPWPKCPWQGENPFSAEELLWIMLTLRREEMQRYVEITGNFLGARKVLQESAKVIVDAILPEAWADNMTPQRFAVARLKAEIAIQRLQASARRFRPDSAWHEMWKRNHEEDGMSYEEIAQAHNKCTGDDVSREAVRKAVRRLTKMTSSPRPNHRLAVDNNTVRGQ